MNPVLAHLENLFSAGPIPFARFMESALYDADFGYYTANIDTVGRGGDFATAATLSENLGNAIARWIREQVDETKIQTVIEIGGGDGSLSTQILKNLGFRLRRKIRYRIVEISPVLRERQRAKIGKKAAWFSTIEDAISDTDEAIIFSNELVDAFPARWFRWENEWQEIFVDFSVEAGLSEKFHPTPDADFPEFLERSGQRVERHDSYKNWLAKWMPKLKTASLLTIDYGGSPTEIYRRLAGTMRGFFRHQRIEGAAIYQRFGKQDLTADVNFDDLKKWGEVHDFQTTGYGTQTDFLRRYKIEGGDLGEANDAFRFLEQAKRSNPVGS